MYLEEREMNILKGHLAAMNRGYSLLSKPTVDIVFDGTPSHESGRFVEVEDMQGKSINLGEWVERTDGYWVLRIPDPREVEKI